VWPPTFVEYADHVLYKAGINMNLKHGFRLECVILKAGAFEIVQKMWVLMDFPHHEIFGLVGLVKV
jgi:hypothetical protein